MEAGADKRTDADHLACGEIYSIVPEETVSAICKVLSVSDDVVHLYVYRKTYAARPASFDDVAPHITAPADVEEARENHACLSRKLFCLWRPVYMATVTPGDDELAGLRQWKLVGGEVMGSNLYVEEEPDNKSVYLRIFLFSGVSFGIVLGLFEGFRYNLVTGIVGGVAGCLLFGGLMTLFQWLGVRNQKSPRIKSAASAQIQEFDLQAPFALAFESGIKALCELDSCTVVVSDPHGGTIEARVDGSGKQFVCVTLYRVGDNQTGVIVSSDPEGRELVDYGKNIWNVETVAAYLKSISSGSTLVRRMYVNKVEKATGLICAIFFAVLSVLAAQATQLGKAEWWVPALFAVFVAMGLVTFFRR